MSRPIIPSARALGALKALNAETYTCSSCSTLVPQKHFLRVRSQHRPHRIWVRSASTVAPVTSVNASRAVPEQNRELHSALSSLEQNAINYVNFSQLTLALRGLESKDPITRIASKWIAASKKRRHSN